MPCEVSLICEQRNRHKNLHSFQVFLNDKPDYQKDVNERFLDCFFSLFFISNMTCKENSAEHGCNLNPPTVLTKSQIREVFMVSAKWNEFPTAFV